MLVKIAEIIVSPNRPPADPEHVKKLLDSMNEVGVFTAITINKKNRLISGLHRLEAAKAIGRTEIECVICELDGLEAELAELDADVIRKDISGVVFGELLLKRKEIYETLHPETKAGTAQAIGMHQALGHRIAGRNSPDGVKNRGKDNVADKMSATLKPDAEKNQGEDNVADILSATLQEPKARSDTVAAATETPAPVKSFVEDTADKMNVTPRTVRRQLQTAKNLDADARNAIKTANLKISKKGAMALSRLEPEKQREAASMLVSGEVKSVGEYTKLRAGVEDTPEESEKTPDESEKAAPKKKAARKEPPKPQNQEPPPFKLEGKRYATFAESVADLKNVDKDVRCTPDIFLAEFTETIKRIRGEVACYLDPSYQEAFPDLTSVQFQYLQDIVNGLRSDLTVLLNSVKEMKGIETPKRARTGKERAVSGIARVPGAVRRHAQPLHQQTDFRPAVPTGC